MSIYRGDGGAGASNDQVTLNEFIVVRDAVDADRVAAAASKTAAEAEVATAAAHVVLTNQDTIDTAADLVLTNADVVLTHADVVLTHADVVLTHADVALTHADVLLTAASVATVNTARNIPSRNTTLNGAAVSQGKSTRSGFSTALYTGNGTNGHAINTGINMSSGDFGGLVWIKDRDSTAFHSLDDTVRGAGKTLFANDPRAPITYSDRLTAFTATGFTLGADSATGVNGSGSLQVAWSWQTTKKTTGTTNGNRAYTSHYNPDLGFSITKYLGNNTQGHQIPHHLGVIPELTMTKNLDAGVGWFVQSSLLTPESGTYLSLETSAAAANSTAFAGTDFGSDVVTTQTGTGVNSNNVNYIRYHFSNVEGVCKIGEYVGNGTESQVIDCGFEPAFVLIKRTNSATSWVLLDSLRPDKDLYPDLASVDTSADRSNFTSNGFDLIGTNAISNAANGKYLFMAYAKSGTGGTGTNTYHKSNYSYPTAADTLSIAQNTLISFARGFDASGQLDTQENVAAGVTHALGTNHESKKYYLYKNLAGSYGVSEYRPLEGITRNDADKYGRVSPLNPAHRTTARHANPTSPTGTVFASAYYSGFHPYQAFNGEHLLSNATTTRWVVETTSASHIGYIGTEKRVLKSYRLMAQTVARLPKRFTVQGSHNGTSWTTIDSSYTSSDYVGNGAFLWGDLQSTAGNTVAYLYHRINITANNGDGTFTVLDELEFNTVLPSDYYLIDAGKVYNHAGSVINRTYLAEFKTDEDGDVINSTLKNLPVAKQRFNEVETHGDLTVHGDINNVSVATAWVTFHGNLAPPLIRSSFNIADIVQTGIVGEYIFYFEKPMNTANYLPMTSSGGAVTYMGEAYSLSLTRNHVTIRFRSHSGTALATSLGHVVFYGGQE